MHYRPHERVAYEVIDGETVLLDLESSRYYSLNRTGTCAWQALAEGAAASNAVGALTERFAVSEEEAAADVGRLIEQLVDAGLLIQAG